MSTIYSAQQLRRAWQSMTGIRHICKKAEEALDAWESDPAGYSSFDEMVESVALIIPASDLSQRLKREGHDELANRISAVRPLANPGRPVKDDKGDNITFTQERGTGSEYTIRRLARDRPDLAEAVARGEMSANAAAIEAGFRKPTATVRLDDMDRLADSLAKRLTDEQLVELRRLLNAGEDARATTDH